ncbi:tape measure protein [Leucobacter viscericola]|uniref:Tape measure protein n=1 Tax=Leucobacter viscericola TaxID=2714935 RepID=A0A6G7XH11_9MICO|nr:tape measure protein [Leucobacter viscericola]QIK63833.1 tape measure protein [Leucobacter viscericola]
MSFEVGRLSAALTLDGMPEFHRGLDDAGRKLNEAGQKGKSFGEAGAAAVRKAAGATTGLVSAAGAYLAILTKTGISYNSLQQNSRAALKVLLGGTEQANEQMSKLDDFARNSPFSKSVFISAQQQLLGFGMEAAKVIPTLDAVQQSVAAMGGSNEQISEVVNILANVQSTGKLTAETLNQLGYRGIDAAQLIGKAWGVTGNDIRDSITDSTLDGRAALEALVGQMGATYGGAADGIKEQWSGAVDRIKAANRDLGAHIAEPFVSAQGGGMAVTWGNQVADVLRAIEKQAIPVMSILTQRGMPFFASLIEGLDKARMSIQRWDASTLDQSLDKLGHHAPGIAALAGATLALGAQVGPLGKVLTTLGISANPVVAAFVGMAAASPEVRESLKGVLEAGKPLVPVVAELATTLSGTLNAALPVVASGVDVFASALKVVVGIVEKIPAPVLVGAAAFLAMHRAAGPLGGVLQNVGDGIQSLAARGAGQAVGEIAGGVGALGSVANVAKGGVLTLGTALKTAFLSNPIGIAITAVSMALGAWAMANAAAQQKVEEHNSRVLALKDTLNETTGAMTKATEATVLSQLGETRAKTLADEMGISYRDMQHAILGNEDALKRVNAAMDKHIATTTTGDENLNTWSADATNAKNRVKEFSEILDDHKSALEDAQQATREKIQSDREAAAALTDAGRSNQRFNEALEAARDITQDAETRVRALTQALDELNGGTKSARQSQTDLNESSLQIADAMKQVDENGNQLWKSFVEGSGQINTSTQAGISFERMLDAANEKMKSATQAAVEDRMAHDDRAGAIEAAIRVGNENIKQMEASLVAGGMQEEQARKVAAAYFDIPSLIATVLTDNDTISETDQKVLQFLSKLSEVPSGKTLTIETEGNEQAIASMKALGFAVKETADKKHVEITSSGEEGVVDALGVINGTYVPKKVLEIDANAANAFSEIDGVNVKVVDGKTAYVYGNTESAMSEIQKVIDQGIPGKTSVVDANDAAFWVKWNTIQAQDAIQKTVQIITETFSVDKGKHFAGAVLTSGFSSGGTVEQFAKGGFPSGMYAGRVGGIWKPGVDGKLHNFAEKELGVPWEAYISGNPAFRERNIGLALESLKRLAFPVVPASQVYGTRAFARGDMLANRTNSASSAAAPVTVSRVERGRDAPLIGSVSIGEGVTRDQFEEFKTRLDFYERGGR